MINAKQLRADLCRRPADSLWQSCNLWPNCRTCGQPRWSRVVGYALHVNPDPAHIPCFRVVNRFGEVSSAFAFGGENEQIALLQREGVRFLPDGRVDLAHFCWDGGTAAGDEIGCDGLGL